MPEDIDPAEDPANREASRRLLGLGQAVIDAPASFLDTLGSISAFRPTQGVRESEAPYSEAYAQPIDPGEAFNRGAAQGEFRTPQFVGPPQPEESLNRQRTQPDIEDSLPGVDIGGLTPQQALEKIRNTARFRPGQPGQAQPQLNPEEQFVQAQLNLQRTQLGPAERTQLQQMTNAVYQIEEQRRSGQISDLMARVMVNKFRPDMEALQSRQAQTPLLQQRLAAIQLQHQTAVAGTVAQQDRLYRSAQSGPETMHAQLADGSVVSYLRRDRDGHPVPLHDQPMAGVDPWMRTTGGVEREILRRQQDFYQRHVQGQPAAGTHWPVIAREIDHTVRQERNIAMRTAQQQNHEARMAQSGQARQDAQQQQQYTHAVDTVTKKVDAEITAHQKAKQTNPNIEAPSWMVSPTTGLTNPQMQRRREIQRRLNEDYPHIQRPTVPNEEPGWNPRVQDLIEALRR